MFRSKSTNCRAKSVCAFTRDLENSNKTPRPKDCLKLEGTDNEYRIRVSSYRVIYEIHDDKLIVTVIAAKHRKDIYKD